MRDIAEYKNDLYGLLEYVLEKYSRECFLGRQSFFSEDQDNTHFGHLEVESSKVFVPNEHLFYRRCDIHSENGDLLCSFILGAADMLYSRAAKSYREKLIAEEHIRGVATLNRRFFRFSSRLSSVILLDNQSYGTWFTTADNIEELVALFCGDLRTDSKTFFSETVSPDNLLPEYYNDANRVIEKNLKEDQLKDLEEVAEVITPKGVRSYEYKSEGIPYLRARDIKEGRILKPEVYVDPEDAPKYSRNLLQEGDILLTKHFGQNKLALVTEEDLPAMASNMLFIIRPFEVSEKYLYKYLTSKTGKEVFDKQLKRIQKGVYVPSITSTDLKKVKIPIFDDYTMQVFGSLEIITKEDSKRSTARLMQYYQAMNEKALEMEVLKALLDVGWHRESFLFERDFDISSNGLKIKWRPDLCYLLDDGRKILLEIKTDLSKVSKDWLSAINQILHGEESFIFVLTTGYYYEVHISGIKQHLKSSNPPTIEDILKWEKEVR